MISKLPRVSFGLVSFGVSSEKKNQTKKIYFYLICLLTIEIYYIDDILLLINLDTD